MGDQVLKPVFGQVCVQYEEQIVGWEPDTTPIPTPESLLDGSESVTEGVLDPTHPTYRVLFPDLPVGGPGGGVVVLPDPDYPAAEVDLPGVGTVLFGIVLLLLLTWSIWPRKRDGFMFR